MRFQSKKIKVQGIVQARVKEYLDTIFYLLMIFQFSLESGSDKWIANRKDYFEIGEKSGSVTSLQKRHNLLR